MGVALLDTSVVVGFLDRDDTAHVAADAAVRSAAAEHVFAVSVVTTAEVLCGARLGHHDEATVRRFFEMTVARRIPLGESEADRAAALRSALPSLRMPDALILATADLNADVVLTGDRRWLSVSGLGCELRQI